MEGGISPGPALLALKEIYGFSLLTDEAHSFMSLGSGGRGSFEHWRDLGYKCDFSKIDMMVCSLSKGVSCNGGFAVANGPFARELRAQGELLAARGAESLSTVLLLRFLSIINKPLLVQERMRLMSEKAKYTSDKLKEAGFRVVSSPGSPVVCFPVGKHSMQCGCRFQRLLIVSRRYRKASGLVPWRGFEARGGHCRRNSSCNTFLVS